MIATVVYDAHVCGPSVCADEAVETGGAGPKMDSSGIQLCERCSTRLCRAKGMKYKCGPGLMCQKCHDKEYPHSRRAATGKRPASPVSDTTPGAEPKRVRRTQSDPGEPSNLTRKRTRAEPPTTTIPAVKKTRARAPAVDPSLLLDQTHAQRLALLAAVATDAAHCVVPNASAVVFDT